MRKRHSRHKELSMSRGSKLLKSMKPQRRQHRKLLLRRSKTFMRKERQLRKELLRRLLKLSKMPEKSKQPWCEPGRLISRSWQMPPRRKLLPTKLLKRLLRKLISRLSLPESAKRRDRSLTTRRRWP